MGGSGYLFEGEAPLEPVAGDEMPVRFRLLDGHEVEWRVLVSLEDHDDTLVFSSRSAFLEWAEGHHRADELKPLVSQVPSDELYSSAGGDTPTLTFEQRLEQVESGHATQERLAAEERRHALEADGDLEARLQAIERAHYREAQFASMEAIDALAAAHNLPIDSLELFLLASGANPDVPATTKTIWLYPALGCTGRPFVVDRYIGNLQLVMQEFFWPPRSARSSGRTAMWDVVYPNPNIPMPVPKTSTQLGITVWDPLLFTPRAANSLP